MKTRSFFITVFIFVTAFPLVSLSQVLKGSWLAGGGISLQRDKSTSESIMGESFDSKTFRFNISPDVMYFPVNKFAAGISTSYTYYKTIEREPDVKGSTYSIGPMFRYYFSLGDDFALYPQFIYRVSRTKSMAFFYDGAAYEKDEYTISASELSVGAGAVYFPNKHVGIEGTLTYSDFEQAGKYYSDYLRSGFEFNVGLQVYFARE
jgi:hypothetical protein